MNDIEPVTAGSFFLSFGAAGSENKALFLPLFFRELCYNGARFLEGDIQMKDPSVVFFATITALMIIVSFLTVKMLSYICPDRWRKTASAAVVALDVLSILGIAGSKNWFSHLPFAGSLLQLLIIWFMFQLFLIAFVGLLLLLRWAWYKCSEDVPFDESRRNMLKQAAVLPTACGISFYGGLYASRKILDVAQEVRLKNITGLDGFKVAQLSDVHLGYFFSLEKLDETLAHIAAQKPDVLMITGDLFDDREMNDAAVSIVDSYVKSFPQGIYFCWGNHEYRRGFAQIEAALASSDIKVLRGQSDLLVPGERPLYVLGADDPQTLQGQEREAKCRATMAQALAGVPENAVKILLAHHSRFIDYAFDQQVDLTLTGHTHGGQIGLLGMSVVPIFKYMRGMYQQGSLYGYVNSGAGSWCPFRFGCPAEVTYFTLRQQV